MNDHQDPYCETVESHLCAMDSPTHPWYLSTKAIFRVVNKATLALKKNHTIFNQSLHGIKELTKLIHSKSERDVLYVDLEKAQSLVEKLDVIRSDQFVVLGDGYDHCRIELSVALRDLISSIAEQQKLAADFLSTKAIESQGFEDSIFGRYIGSSQFYQAAVTELQAAQDQLKLRYPEFYARAEQLALEGIVAAQAVQAHLLVSTNNAQRYSTELLEQADTTIRSTSTELMQRAHPYIHAAYSRGLPVVATALQWSQPFLQLFRPLLEPLKVRAEHHLHTLTHHTLTGPAVVHVLDQAKTVLEQTKAYCERTDLDEPLLVAQPPSHRQMPTMDMEVEVNEGIRL